jgi:hypothetical protein
MTGHQVVQAATWLLALMGLGIWARWARRYPDLRLYAAAPITWLGHALIFYSAVFIRDAGRLPVSLSFTNWSTVLRLHAMILLVGFGALLLWGRVRLWGRR